MASRSLLEVLLSLISFGLCEQIRDEARQASRGQQALKQQTLLPEYRLSVNLKISLPVTR
jgi:hypothetical protein